MTSRTAHTHDPTQPVYDKSSRHELTYDWNGHTHVIDRPDLDDYNVAAQVRMLSRAQLDHEAICELGRSRIMGLSKELARVKAELADVTKKLAGLEDDARDILGQDHG